MNADGDFLDRVEAILREAKAAPAAERDALIRRRAGSDPRLRREVEAMLRAEAAMGEAFLKHSVSAALQSEIDPTTRRVGPWAIEEMLGTGGMGVVFRGRRADGAYEAEVAIKFVRETLADPTLRDRFLRERQFLATLDHPNIARLLDGGVTELGRPYLVMELVRGASLIQYCDANRATVETRLQLFDHVCRAVQHAHGHLIVHRDLKSSNILVDDDGRPRLLDFGIASMLSDTDADGTITATTQRRFTPQYAAPEQILGEPATVAADVYSLGVILYELLVGARPYEVTNAHSPQDAQTICEREPPRPSRRLSATGDDPATDITAIARSRSTEPAALRRTLRGDLDHIIMTALRKEPSRRYATAEALREDLDRFRQGLPVAARPDSWRYRTARFIGRHRAAVVVAAALGVAITAAAIISTTLAVRLSEQTVALERALEDRQEALDAANDQRRAAEREYRRALSSTSALIQTLVAISAEDQSVRQRIVDHVRDRIGRLDAMTLPVSADAEIATRQALAMLARTIEAYDVALEQNRRVLALTDGRPEERDVRAQTYGQIGWLHLQRAEPHAAIAALRTSRAVGRSDLRAEQRADHLTLVDLHLIEALLMIEDVDAARAVLAERTFPPAPVDALMRLRLRDLEARFDARIAPAAAE